MSARILCNEAAVAAPMSAERAMELEAAEDISLFEDDANATGFRGVCYHPKRKTKPYQARIKQDGKIRSLGYYSSNHEAALEYARAAARRAALAGPVAAQMSAERAMELAAAEDISLIEEKANATGFRGVCA